MVERKKHKDFFKKEEEGKKGGKKIGEGRAEANSSKKNSMKL